MTELAVCDCIDFDQKIKDAEKNVDTLRNRARDIAAFILKWEGAIEMLKALKVEQDKKNETPPDLPPGEAA